MHRIAATPGGWNPDTEGVILVEQTPAPIVILTAADTEIQSLARSIDGLPADFPPVRAVNLLQLQQQLSIDTYAEEVLAHAQVIVLRLLGGRSYWSYGLEVVQETVSRTGASLIVLPGDDRPDPDLISHSTVPLAIVNQIWRYWIEGGIDNTKNLLMYLANTGLGSAYEVNSPRVVPRVGLYRQFDGSRKVGILFYRAHYLAGNTTVIDDLCEALCDRGLTPVPVFISSLRDPDAQADLVAYFHGNSTEAIRCDDELGMPPKSPSLGDFETERFSSKSPKIGGFRGLQPPSTQRIELLLNTTSFSLASPDDADAPELWKSLDVPVLQVILSGGTIEQWNAQFRGLSPRDTAMNVALPEVDGRIISRAVSFKAVQTQHPILQTDVVTYQSVPDRIEFVAELAQNWVRLRQTEIVDRRVALILANYPTRDGRLANGVGLDTPESCVEILKAMQKAGYTVKDIPETGDQLIERLTQGITNDPESKDFRKIEQVLSLETYQNYFATLSLEIQQQIDNRWQDHQPESNLAIPGIQLGNVFVGIQPSRGYDLDPSLNYHAPDLEPTPAYLAFYQWIKQEFSAHAIVHVGKHGNLEWLPGKSVALSQTCYPEIALGALPHLYPFIVNDPGEGSQAKRRAQAVIIDHLTPPMTRAELYGGLHKLEAVIDEYYEALNLNPSRIPVIRDRITELIQQENLDRDLTFVSKSVDDLITNADRYLCELKEAQIRDGLHIFGNCPEGRQLRDLIVAIARHPQPGRLGLTRAIAQDWQLDFDPLTADPAEPLPENPEGWYTVGDAITSIEAEAAQIVEQLLDQDLEHQSSSKLVVPINSALIPNPSPQGEGSQSQSPSPRGEGFRVRASTESHWILNTLIPALRHTSQEIDFLLHGLNGGYVPAAPSGAPTRGRPEVLPTGRNFYSVDIRAIPTESAWQVGRKAAEAVIERYTQEHGDYPKTLGLSIWGTSTMRTGGDDFAEALALLGVQPVWEGVSRRIVDFEILPLSILGRPRIDVTLRISGFFRDAFPNLIDLFDQAVAAIAALDEPTDQNPLAAQVQQETQRWQATGLTPEQADRRSRYRVFGSKPGAYGAGLQGLIEAQNWTDDQDLARSYINWSSYAYVSSSVAHSAPEAFENRLRDMQIVLHNQDNREHDLLDSDDYYQFQGGLTVAARSLQGKNPTTYFGDHALPEQPKIRSLQEQIARVYRSRVVNPKWLEGAMRHGYKGAFEMAATIDYLFAYDATARCVEDFMYEGVAQAYLLDETVQRFIQSKNPWALRDMAERLLEANQRGLWKDAKTNTLEQLRAIVLQAEGKIEEKLIQQ